MKLSELLSLIPAEYINGAENLSPKGISCDSRTVQPGDVFVCIRGEHVNGERFVAEAITMGAISCVTEDPSALPEGFPCAVVDDARRALAFMWSAYCAHPEKLLSVACVTGSCGKTSVAAMLHRILSESGERTGLMGTVCTAVGDERLPYEDWSEVSSVPAAMTTPDPKYLYKNLRIMRDRGCDTIVMEASSHALSQRKLDPITPSVAVFTNLSHEHLDYHGDMESYFFAKLRLFDKARKGIVNVSDPYGKRIADLVPGCDCRLLAEGKGGDYLVSDVCFQGLLGVSYTFHTPKEKLCLSVPLPGSFTVENSALASAAALELGVASDTVVRALSNMPPVSGRMERIYEGDFTVIRDYAHTPASMEKVLASLRRYFTGRLITVFGCGGDRDRSKRAPMGECATRLSDVTVITSDNSRSEDPIDIIEQILRGAHKEKEHILIPDRREGIEYALSVAKKGDTVVLLGKGHETYEIDRWGKHPFDERVIVEKYLKKS